MAEQLGKELDINSYTENYLRLHLLEVKGGTLVLRNLFLKIVKSSPANGDVDKYLSYFEYDIKRHKHGSDELKILFPSSGKTDLGKWDVSLLAYVLIHCCTLEGQLNLKGKHNLRSILNKEIENRSDLSRFLLDNQTKLRALKITKKQYEILYPGDLQHADLEAWDIELVLQVLYTCFNDVWVKKKVSRVCTAVLNRHVEIFSPVIVLDELLRHHQCKFDKLKLEETLTDIQYKQIFPSKCVSDTANWDNEVLICVVVKTCQSLSQDTYNAVKTIRQLRKELGAHTAHTEINNDEFLDKWTDLYEAILDITITEIPEMKNDVKKATTYLRKGPLDIQNAVTYLKPWYANQDTILVRLSVIESKNESTNSAISREMKQMRKDIEDLKQNVGELFMRVPEKQYNARRKTEELKVVVTTNAENEEAGVKAETSLFKSLDGVEDDDTKQLKDCTDSIRKMHLNDGNAIAGIEKGSIILVIKCSSLRGVHNLMKTLNSNELKDTFEQLQDVLSKINECPIRLGVHLTNSSLLKIVDMIAKYAFQTEETSSPDEPSLLLAETQLQCDQNQLREVKIEPTIRTSYKTRKEQSPEPTSMSIHKVELEHSSSFLGSNKYYRSALTNDIRTDLLYLIEDLERIIPVIRAETQFWHEFQTSFPSIDMDIQLHKYQLGEKRPIVVVGEVSSGKSSFINLMLGVYLLPVGFQQTTTGIIKVQKSNELAVIPNGRLPITTNDCKINDHKIAAAAFVRNALLKWSETATTEVEVHWPFENDVLKENITIVDTPGYKEALRVDDMLMRYLDKAVGVLYIMDARKARWIQTDLMIQNIKDQIVYYSKHNLKHLDPRALFLFNKWDTLEDRAQFDFCYEQETERLVDRKAEQHKVWNSIINGLRTTWTEFTPDQAMKFSVYQANGILRGQCIGVDEDQVNIAITKATNVVEKRLKNELYQTKRWIDDVNGTISKHLSAAKAERGILFIQYHSEIDQVIDTLEIKKRQIPQHIESKTRAFATTLERHIKSNSVQREMQNWCYDDFPCSLLTDSEDTIKRETARVVLRRLSSIMQRDMKNEAAKFSRDLAKYLQKETGEMQELVKRLDSIVTFMSHENKSSFTDRFTVVSYDIPAYDWLMFNYMDVGEILNVYTFQVNFYLPLRFQFLVNMVSGRSPHVTILLKTSGAVMQDINAELLFTAISKRLKQLEDKIKQFFEEITRNQTSLRKQFVYNSKDRYTRLSHKLTPYLDRCEQVL